MLCVKLKRKMTLNIRDYTISRVLFSTRSEISHGPVYMNIDTDNYQLGMKVYLRSSSRRLFSTLKILLQPGRWHNGSAFVFCSCGCTFESEPSPTSAHACGEVTGCAPAAKRSASVAPEVNLGECTLHSPPQK